MTVSGGGAMPAIDLADPALFETTPQSVLAGSAMNGFNKGIETPYAADASPVSDATAVHGTRLLRDALPHVAGDRPDDPAATDRAVVGALLVQLGRKISVIHAFGHGFARVGTTYSRDRPRGGRAARPRVPLRRGGREPAGALANGSASRPRAATTPRSPRTWLARSPRSATTPPVPSRLRELDPVDEDDFPAIAEYIADDWSMEQAPADLDATPEAIEGVLREAW